MGPEGVTIIQPDEDADVKNNDDTEMGDGVEADDSLSRPAVPDVDWACSACGDMNRAGTDRCITCGLDAPWAQKQSLSFGRVESDVAETTATQERWECVKCGEVNKPDRSECNACGARNPALPPLPEKARKTAADD